MRLDCRRVFFEHGRKAEKTCDAFLLAPQTGAFSRFCFRCYLLADESHLDMGANQRKRLFRCRLRRRLEHTQQRHVPTRARGPRVASFPVLTDEKDVYTPLHAKSLLSRVKKCIVTVLVVFGPLMSPVVPLTHR